MNSTHKKLITLGILIVCLVVVFVLASVSGRERHAIKILQPSEGEVYGTNSPLSIEWQSDILSSTTPVNIYLIDEKGVATQVKKDIPNFSQLSRPGSAFTWLKIPGTFQDGTYRAEVRIDGVSTTSSPFRISNASTTTASSVTYKDSVYDLVFDYPVGSSIVEADHARTDKRGLYVFLKGVGFVAIDMTPHGQCIEGGYVPMASQHINGISFSEYNTGGDHGGMESSGIGKSYCVVHNDVSYRMETYITYSRYPCESGKTGEDIPGCVPPAPPTEQEYFPKFDRVIESMNIRFSN